MAAVVLDANAVIMHGRTFPERVRGRHDHRDRLVLPRSVKTELIDNVLNNPEAPPNHRASAADIQELIDDGDLDLMAPDFDRYGDIVDEARRRLAGDSLPEHAVKADQYIPALVCELSECGPVTLVTADGKLRRVVVEIARKHQIYEKVDVSDPGSVL